MEEIVKFDNLDVYEIICIFNADYSYKFDVFLSEMRSIITQKKLIKMEKYGKQKFRYNINGKKEGCVFRIEFFSKDTEKIERYVKNCTATLKYVCVLKNKSREYRYRYYITKILDVYKPNWRNDTLTNDEYIELSKILRAKLKFESHLIDYDEYIKKINNVSNKNLELDVADEVLENDYISIDYFEKDKKILDK